MPCAAAHLCLPTFTPSAFASLPPLGSSLAQPPSTQGAARPHCHQAKEEQTKIRRGRGRSANAKQEGKSAKKPTRGEANTYPTSTLVGLTGLGASLQGHMWGRDGRMSMTAGGGEG